MKKKAKAGSTQGQQISCDIGETLVPQLFSELSIETGNLDEPKFENAPVKPSRAARRREKRAAERRAQEEAALKASNAVPNSSRSIELRKIEEKLSQRNLRVFEVPSDGDCLYLSIAHQLQLLNIPIKHLLPEEATEHPLEGDRRETRVPHSTPTPSHFVQQLRFLAAQHLRVHKADFLPFLFNPETGEPMTIAEFDAYCDAVEKTSAWGGQVEVRALSNVLQVPIEILQAEGASVIVGDEFSGPPLTIVYHRHAFALGEHYNSCIPLTNSSAT
ncbi:unnamed protein product [Calicophoron daubneyi]|uniref:OTU domain-containing protein n=1 Tax=Calicophoron daubneyi TaxID=300641 RepID=A0AAV2T7M0_CALDB